MILVAGLAVVGLAGIAAAFYFSMRPGGSRARAVPGSRDRGPRRAVDDRLPASRSRTTRPSSSRSDRSASPARSAGGARSGSGRALDRTGSAGSSTVIDFTGPQPVLEDPEPLVTGRRARHGDRGNDGPDEPGLTPRVAARHSQEAEPDDAAATPKSRRRVGWRKGSDVDEELWPVEAFGGISDEQFWDDLAADKPLATTARTAQPEGAARRRPPNAGPLPDLRPADDRRRADGRPGTHPQARLGPDDRTAIQPAQTGAQSSATAPFATQPYPAATQPSPIATQPVRAVHQPAEPRRRPHAGTSADEDPLTSPKYSLRRKGSVDGRGYSSSRRSGELTREQYEAAAGQQTQTFSVAQTRAAGGGYPDGVPPFRQFDQPAHSGNGSRGRSGAGGPDPLGSDRYRTDPLRSDPLRPDPLRPDPLRPDPLRPGDGHGSTARYAAQPYLQQPYGEPTQSMNTPPYGERYGYPNPADQAGPVGWSGSIGDPRRADGGWNPGQAAGNGAGDGSFGSRSAYPPVNGYHGPYDPRGYDRRLRSLPRPRAH
jgi:hypothetical protein